MKKNIKIYQVDAFTDKVFGGNPAAVCLLDEWLDDETMQQIGAENNMSETAFLVEKDGGYEIRWFTPAVEVDLCGHATLASGHILFEHLGYNGDTINFHSPRSGNLSVSRDGDMLSLNFPRDICNPVDTPPILKDALRMDTVETFKGKTDYIAVFSSQEEILSCNPDFDLISALGGRGVIITAPGDDVDFVSRFFAPQSGINEDPVTGSAHTSLTPIWAGKLEKTKLTAKQLSKRGGELFCELQGERTIISGKAVTYLVGEISI